jgi:hypothetical protein
LPLDSLGPLTGEISPIAAAPADTTGPQHHADAYPAAGVAALARGVGAPALARGAPALGAFCIGAGESPPPGGSSAANRRAQGAGARVSARVPKGIAASPCRAPPTRGRCAPPLTGAIPPVPSSPPMGAGGSADAGPLPSLGVDGASAKSGRCTDTAGAGGLVDAGSTPSPGVAGANPGGCRPVVGAGGSGRGPPRFASRSKPAGVGGRAIGRSPNIGYARGVGG